MASNVIWSQARYHSCLFAFLLVLFTLFASMCWCDDSGSFNISICEFHPDELSQAKHEKQNPTFYLWSEANNCRCHHQPSTGTWSRIKDLKRISKILLKAIKCFSNFIFSFLFLTEKEQMVTEVNSAIWKDWKISMKRARCQVCSVSAHLCQLSTSKRSLNKG